MHRRNFLKSAGALGLLSGAAFNRADAAVDPDQVQIEALGRRYGAWGFDLSGMDHSARPGDDFFRFANGKAVDSMLIPGDLPSYSAWDKLADLSELRVKRLIMGLAERSDLSGDEIKLRDLFQSLVDQDLRQRLDLSPAQKALGELATISDHTAMARRLGSVNGTFGRSLFDALISADPGEPSVNVVKLIQSGFGMPDRDYYLAETYADKKVEYEVYVTDMLRIIGWPDPNGAAKAVVAFETEVARMSWTRTQMRDPVKTYNPMDGAGLRALAPGFGWDAWFEGAGLNEEKRFIVMQPSSLVAMSAMFLATPLPTLRAWQVMGMLDQSASLLCDRIRLRHREFYFKTLWGIEEDREPWKRAVTWTSDVMGDAIGRAYVENHFSPRAKASAETLVANLLAAMKARITAADWMSEVTRMAALAKLSAIKVKIAYPETWRDYADLEIRPDDPFGNAERWYAFEWRRQRNRLDKPVDRNEWTTTPQTANAFYSQLRNDITFPAAILQPPFFDVNADPAVNYGAIGAVIGHEITHAFDSRGRRYDGEGRLRDWWTSADDDAFHSRQQAFGEQVSAYEPVPGKHVDSELTMAENIADLGGCIVALNAYEVALGGAEAPARDGFSGTQRFFLGWAQLWATRYRYDYLISMLSIDTHSPDMVRTVSPLRNMDAWYDAFHVEPGDGHYVAPESRSRIW